MKLNKSSKDLSKQAATMSALPALRDLDLNELRAVAGGMAGQKARPDPTVYPQIQNNSP